MTDFLIVSGGVILWLIWLAVYAWFGQGVMDELKNGSQRREQYYDDTH